MEVLYKIICFILFACTIAELKPLKRLGENLSEIESPGNDEMSRLEKIKYPFARSTFEARVDEAAPSLDTSNLLEIPGATAINSPNNSYNYWLTLFHHLLQKFQFSPQTFVNDRLNFIREALENLSLALSASNGTRARQLNNANSLIHVVGLDNHGFYTNRLDPAGFFDGNGWLANKGGLLGGPGAILSTGSLLTDYPSAYKKK